MRLLTTAFPWALGLGALLLCLPAAWAKAKIEVNQEACDRLFAAIQVHDNIYPGVTLPARIHLEYKKDALNSFYRLSEKLWRDGFDPKELRRAVQKLASGGTLNPAEEVYYKAVRAKFKQLRFAFAAFDENHEYPARFDKLTAAMGHFQDALKNKDMAKARQASDTVIQLLDKKSLRAIDDELEKFKPSGRGSFQKYVTSELGELAELASEPKVTAKQFHEMRKVISRQVAIFDTIQTVNPSPETLRIVQYLSSLNGAMGGYHDQLIRQSFLEGLNYREDLIDMPNGLGAKLKVLVDAYAEVDKP